LEIEYLFEIKKINIGSKDILEYLHENIGLTTDEVNLNALIRIALHESWTRDPFDRIIVSHAKMKNAALVTRDKIILKHYHRAIS
jgi:PIN domain nuclease of toxin-antitoxin system